MRQRLITFLLLFTIISSTVSFSGTNSVALASTGGGGGIVYPVPTYKWDFTETYAPQSAWFADAYKDSIQMIELYDVCYGNDVFVCIGTAYDKKTDESFPAAAVSSDGYIWQIHRADKLSGIREIELSGRYFIGYPRSASEATYVKSYDGVEWWKYRYTEPGQIISPESISVTDGRGVYMSGSHDSGAKIYKTTLETSNDWQEVYSVEGCSINDIKCFNGELIAIGTNGFIATSKDGENWSVVTDVTTDKNLCKVAKINGTIYIFGSSTVSEELILTRSFSGEWTVYNPSDETTADITVTQYGFFRHNDSGLTQVSQDGLKWTDILRNPEAEAFAASENTIVAMTNNRLLTASRVKEFSAKTFVSDKEGLTADGGIDCDTAFVSIFVVNPANMPCTVMAAMYDENNRLLSMQTSKKAYEEQSFSIVFKLNDFKQYYTIKTFFWENVSLMQPTAKPYICQNINGSNSFDRYSYSYTFMFEANSNNGLIDNTPVVFENAPILADGEILVDDYHAIKALGGGSGSFDWDNERMVCEINGKTITFTAGSDYAETDNGNVLLSTPVQIINGYDNGVPCRMFYIPLEDTAAILDRPFERIGNKLYTKPSWDIHVNDTGFIAVSELCGLRILACNDEKMYLPDNCVSRSEFCQTVSRLMNPDKPSFYLDAFDVPRNHWAYPAIGYCVNSGYMSLENNKFRPDENITGAEAVNAVVRIFDQDVQGDILLHAEQLGLLDGLVDFEPTQPLTRLHLAQLLYNAYLKL